MPVPSAMRISSRATPGSPGAASFIWKCSGSASPAAFQAGQIRIDGHLQLVVAHGDQAGIARLAVEMAGQALHQRRRIILAETIGRDDAAELDDDGVVALRAAAYGHRAAEEVAR